MVIWQHTIAELRRLLERHGAFRQVRGWGLVTDPTPALVPLRAGTNPAVLARSHKLPYELLDALGRRLILVLSDCVSSAWYHGDVLRELASWGQSNPVAIVQMLPQYLWLRTALDMPIMRLRAHSPGLPNRRLTVERRKRRAKEEHDGEVPIPVITLGRRSVEAWARVVAGIGGARVPGIVVSTAQTDDVPPASPTTDTNSHQGIPANDSAPEPSLPSAAAMCQRFRTVASPMAYKLAGYLAAVPLTLPVMRLVQHVMLPESEQVHLAEVFLSGLLKRCPPDRHSMNLDDIVYDFHTGVRAFLLNAVLLNDALRVLETVSDYVCSRSGRPFDFRAIVANPALMDTVDLLSGDGPFAFVAISVLRRFGGKYAQVADKWEMRLAPSASDPLEEARQALAAKNYLQAIFILQGLLQRDPQHTHADALLREAKRRLDEDIQRWLLQATDSYKRGLMEEVEALCQRVLECDPTDATAQSYMASVLQERVAAQRRAEVEDKVRQACILMRDVTLKHYNEAILLLKAARYEQPEDFEIESILWEAEKKRASLLEEWGQLATLVETEQYGEAIEKVKALIDRGDLEYEDRNIFTHLRDVERQARNYADRKALQYLEDVKPLLPGNPEVVAEKLQEVLILSQLPEERRRQVQAALDDVQRRMRNRQEAQRLVDEALTSISTAGNYREALALLGRAKGLDPHWPALLHYEEELRKRWVEHIVREMHLALPKAKLALEQGNLVEAERWTMQTLDAAAEEPEAPAVAACVTEAQTLLEAIARAQQVEREIMRAQPLIEAYLGKDDYGLAEDEVQRLAAMAPQDPRVQSLQIRLAGSQAIVQVYAHAERALSEGKSETARQLCEQLLARDAGHKEARHLLVRAEAAGQYRQGRTAMVQGDLRTAETCFEHVIQRAGDQADEARQFLEEVRRYLTNDVSVAHDLTQAQACYDAGRYEEALALLQPLAETPSSHLAAVTALLSRVREAWRQVLHTAIKEALDRGQTDAAWKEVTILRQNLGAVDPEDRRLQRQVRLAGYRQLAEAYARQQRWTEARQEWEEVADIDPANREVYERLVEARRHERLVEVRRALSRQDFSHALDVLTAAEAETSNDQEVLTLLAKTCLQAGRYAEAEQYCERLQLAFPHAADVHALWGTITQTATLHKALQQAEDYFLRGAYREAVQQMEALCARQPQEKGLQRRKQEMTQQAVEALLQRIHQCEQEERNSLKGLLLYLELHSLNPEGPEVQARLLEVRQRTTLYLQDLLARADGLTHDREATLLRVEETFDALTQVLQRCERSRDQALLDQTPELRSRIAAMGRQLHTLQDLERILNHSNQTLWAACRTGDFREVDRQVAQAQELAPQHPEVRQLVQTVAQHRVQRRATEHEVARLTAAFVTEDFTMVSQVAHTLTLWDPDDVWQMQAQALSFDPLTQEEVQGVAQHLVRAQQKQHNLEAIEAWERTVVQSLGTLEGLYQEAGKAMQIGELAEGERRFEACVVRCKEVLVQIEGEMVPLPQSRRVQAVLAAAQQTLELVRQVQHAAAQGQQECQQRAKEFEELLRRTADILNAYRRGGDVTILLRMTRPLVTRGLQLQPQHERMRHYANLLDELSQE